MTCGELKAHRGADVMDDEVETAETKGIDSAGGEPSEAGPRVVEVGRPVGQAETGKVEREASQPAIRELGHHLAIKEARGRNAVQAEHRVPLPGVQHERSDPV